jgi:hypothetical protein
MSASRGGRDVWYNQKLRTPVPRITWSMVACNVDGGYDRARRKDVGGGIRRVSQRAQSRKRSSIAASSGR